MACKVMFLPEGKRTEVPEGTTISDAAVRAGISISLPCGGAGRCGRCIVEADGQRVLACRTQVADGMTVTVPEGDSGKVIASTEHSGVDPGDLSPMTEGYGLAVDIGTTTVAVCIIDLSDGSEIYDSADMNRQRIRGEDVLSRIEYAGEGGTEELRSLVIDTINDLIGGCHVPGFSPEKITSVYIAGNTSMTYLFLGIDPTPLRYPPFEPEVREAEITGKESGLTVSESARVVCMPSVASYVGGDITSDIVYSGMDEDDGLALLIDVGTNGEVAIGSGDMLLTCSSSAGPAFEGSQMTSGMLAREGAIDSVRIEDGKMHLTVIGGGRPKGICGSGIIDLVAELFRAGMIDRRGNLTEASGAKDGVLRIADDVIITQSEITNVIMTKAAIYSAAGTMVRTLGVSMDDIGTIYIAGGFGNFIDTESAITIGLLPDVDRSKYRYLGNASLAGARSALVSQRFRDRVAEAFPKMTYVDLGSDAVFYDEYMSAQFLPHTDDSRFPSVMAER